MSEVGNLGADDYVELIQGQIIDMPPIGPRHALASDRLARLLITRVDNDVMVRMKGPILLKNYAEPRPGVAVVRSKWLGRPKDHPGSNDVHLLVEFADSSAANHCEFKAALYARFRIREYWIVDLLADEIIIIESQTNFVIQECSARGVRKTW
jgi:Uma2 family endonuclease